MIYNFQAEKAIPKTKRERQKSILIIILNGTLVLLVSAWLIMALNIVLKEPPYQASLSLAGAGLLIFLVIFWRLLAHWNYARLASWLLIFSLTLFAAYMGWRWGVDLPAAILFYALIVVMSSILLGKRATTGVTVAIIILISTTAWAHLHGLKAVDHAWSKELWQGGEVVAASLIFIIISVITWLFNRELDVSEKALQDERDDLERQVEEKTAALKIAKAKEIEHTYHLAELGRLSSGIFHDLANPLTALMFNIDQAHQNSEKKIDWEAIQQDISEARSFCQRMRCLLEGARSQAKCQSDKKDFSLNQEIINVLNLLNYSARCNNVVLNFKDSPDIILHNDAVKFSRIISNLVNNAIEATDKFKKDRWVRIEAKEINRHALITVTDNGKGFDNSLKEKIMEPFFSTKTGGTSLGLGLAIVQRLVKEDFNGTIRALSKEGKYTILTLDIPINK